jgi:hypothetical protein
MDWFSLIAVVVVAGLVSAALVGIATLDLRRHLARGLDAAASRQAQSLQRLLDEHRAALARIDELQRVQRKMAAEIADLYDRVGEGKGEAGSRLGGARFLN